MSKPIKKLSLKRQTLRQLSPDELSLVRGGDTGFTVCTNECFTACGPGCAGTGFITICTCEVSNTCAASCPETCGMTCDPTPPPTPGSGAPWCNLCA